MNLFSAQGAYGYSGNSLINPGGTSMQQEQPGIANSTPGSLMPNLSLSWDNPLFWLLILFLVWSGYLYFGFSFGIKKIINQTVKVGK